jgi:hypothetical protein
MGGIGRHAVGRIAKRDQRSSAHVVNNGLIPDIPTAFDDHLSPALPPGCLIRMLPWGRAKALGLTPHMILMLISNLLNQKDCLASSTDFPANHAQPLARDRIPDENFLSRDQVSLSSTLKRRIL